jgi:hypothetical protein
VLTSEPEFRRAPSPATRRRRTCHRQNNRSSRSNTRQDSPPPPSIPNLLLLHLFPTPPPTIHRQSTSLEISIAQFFFIAARVSLASTLSPSLRHFRSWARPETLSTSQTFPPTRLVYTSVAPISWSYPVGSWLTHGYHTPTAQAPPDSSDSEAWNSR